MNGEDPMVMVPVELVMRNDGSELLERNATLFKVFAGSLAGIGDFCKAGVDHLEGLRGLLGGTLNVLDDQPDLLEDGNRDEPVFGLQYHLRVLTSRTAWSLFRYSWNWLNIPSEIRFAIVF